MRHSKNEHSLFAKPGFMATLFYSISLKPCRGRRPRRPEKQQVLLFIRLPIIAGCKLKKLLFPGRRGRRPLQAKNQAASTRRYREKKTSFSGGQKAIAVAPYRQKIKPHRYAERAFFSPRRGYGKFVRRPQRLRRCPPCGRVRLRFAPLRVTQKR